MIGVLLLADKDASCKVVGFWLVLSEHVVCLRLDFRNDSEKLGKNQLSLFIWIITPVFSHGLGDKIHLSTLLGFWNLSSRSVKSWFCLRWERHSVGIWCIDKENCLCKSDCWPSWSNDSHYLRRPIYFIWDWRVGWGVEIAQLDWQGVRTWHWRSKRGWIKTVCWVDWRHWPWALSLFPTLRC